MSFYVGESIDEEYPMMNRRLGMKRSWNCEDLSSIDLERRHARAMEAQSLTSPSNNNFSPRKRMRRYRATSLDSSEEKPTIPARFSVAASVSDDSITPKALVAPRPSSPSHVASVVTPESNSSSEEVGSLPYFPSLRRNRSVSCDFPATAALERFMVKHRSSPTSALLGNSSEDHFSVSFEDSRSDDDYNQQIWPSSNFDHDDDEEDEDKAISNQTRRVSMSSRKSSALSSTSTSSCKLHPSPKSIPQQRVAPTVRQITKALESLARI